MGRSAAVRSYVGEFGLAYFVAGLARRGAQHSRYARSRLTGRRPTFTYHGRQLEHYWHPYNRTWLGERAIEIPIALEFVAGWPTGSRGLEIGNVLGHYGVSGHRVVDKYEVHPGVENLDVVDIGSATPLDWIVAISTLEHVGWDEPDRDVGKAVVALDHLRSLLAPTGRMLLTVPLGHNPGLDAHLLGGGSGSERSVVYVRSPKDHWTETTFPAPSEARYLYELRSAGALWVGELGRP